MKVIFSICLLIISMFSLNAQGIIGQWKTIDDDTGKPRSVVEIYENNGKYYGRIIKLFREPGEEQDPVCDVCPGPQKGKKIIGLEIIRNLIKEDDEYGDGTILDPESGKVYDCKIWLEDGTLKVRGYIAFLFRTQTWLPYKQ